MIPEMERPPFPIIIERPTLGDVARNLQTSDFFAWATIYGLGYVGGFFQARSISNVKIRYRAFALLTHTFGVVGFTLAFYASYTRLTGYWDNGLRWNVPKQEVDKFDTTSKFEANTIFKRFRIRTD